MTFDFSNYLLRSDNSTGCYANWSSESTVVSNAKNGYRFDEHIGANLSGNQPNGIWRGIREPSSRCQCNVPNIVINDCDDDVIDKCPSRRPTVEDTLTGQKVTSAQTGSHETLSWKKKIEHLSQKQLRVCSVGRSHSSVGDLTKLLQSLKTTMKMSPAGLSDPDPGRLIESDPDGQNHDRKTLRQPPYRSRRSLPSRLTDDHVTPAKQEARKKYSRRGSVKFADEFGLNLNTFAMIPSRFSEQALNDVNWRLHSKNRKWNSDDRILDCINRNAATDGFRWMEPGWDFASDLRLFLSDDDEGDETLRLNWDPLEEFRSKNGLSGVDYSYRRFSREKRSSKQEVAKQETPRLEVAKPEAEFHQRRHEFRLRFEQPFADLDLFQRKLRENFLCLENVRVDDRLSRTGGDGDDDDDLNGTGPSRKRQGTTILCSIKVRHTSEGLIIVFSRCTDNDWATSADLPAQHLSEVTNLGFDYDTFCFAVRKPVQAPREEDDVNSGPTSAVEFAICCRVTNEGRTTSHWDNNGGSNYRIEWFDD